MMCYKVQSLGKYPTQIKMKQFYSTYEEHQAIRSGFTMETLSFIQ